MSGYGFWRLSNGVISRAVYDGLRAFKGDYDRVKRGQCNDMEIVDLECRLNAVFLIVQQRS